MNTISRDLIKPGALFVWDTFLGLQYFEVLGIATDPVEGAEDYDVSEDIAVLEMGTAHFPQVRATLPVSVFLRGSGMRYVGTVRPVEENLAHPQPGFLYLFERVLPADDVMGWEEERYTCAAEVSQVDPDGTVIAHVTCGDSPSAWFEGFNPEERAAWTFAGTTTRPAREAETTPTGSPS